MLVVGMHRSGTSMVGGMLAALGVRMGRRLVAADAQNQRGYFEDIEIVEFHGRIFRERLPQDAAGHVDWGWTETGLVQVGPEGEYAEEARRIAAERSAQGGAWGFKDPRTTVCLDLWDAILAEARYLLVYRFPWEVADSMLRGGAGVFVGNPSYGYRIWEAYNRRLLEFYEQHADRCLLLNLAGLVRDLPRFQELAGAIPGLSLDRVDLTERFDPALLTRGDADDHRADLVAAAYPECIRLLERLDDRADISGHGLWRRDTPARTEMIGPMTPQDAGAIDLTIVVPTHGDAVLLLDALASLEQCRPPRSEVIVIDDGSTDRESLRILEALRTRGYQVERKEAGGLSSARNAGIALARGRYILPLDADNRLLPGFCEAAMELLDEEPDLGVVYGDRRLFGGSSGLLEVPEFDLDRLLGGNYIDACAVYRRTMWEDLGGYDTAMLGLEDWEFWMHAGWRGWRFRRRPGAAFAYRVRPGSLLARCLGLSRRVSLFRHLLGKHPELFHSRVPAPLRVVSTLLGAILPTAMLGALKRLEARVFWWPFWLLIGPGGFFSRRGRPVPDQASRKTRKPLSWQ